MPSLNRNEKVKCEDCGKEYRRSDEARHRKSCVRGVISCPDCRYITYNQQEMNYHVVKKHAPSTSKQSTVCLSCEQDFPSYYSLQQHRRKEHGAKQRKPSDTVADLNKIVEEEGEDGEKLKEELSACQQFLVDTEMENGRHKVFNFQMSKLDTKIIIEKLEEVFNKLDSAAKSILLLDLFSVMSKRENIGITMHTKTIFYSKNRIYCVRKRISLQSRETLKSLISLSNAPKNVRTQSGDSS